MRTNVIKIAYMVVLLTITSIFAEPGFNGPTPGCGGSGCHTVQTGILSVTLLSNFQVRISLSGTTASVGGELVNQSGTVVAVNNSTGNNPFTLTAPSAGVYKVNAGYKNPSRRWDSTTIVISPTGIIGDLIEGTPHTYKLYNNYPNPFNPTTKIIFSVPERSIVRLRIFDAIGNEIASPINEERSTGNYIYNFDGGELSSGIYFYKLEAVPVTGNGRVFKQTKKMILTK